MSDYNGWTNYATWRVNLEIFDGWSPYDCGHDSSTSAYDLGLALKDIAGELMANYGEGLTFDYAMAFLSDVNWTEIARHIIEAYAERAA